MALVLTRKIGESVRLSDADLKLNFDIKIIEVRELGIFSEIKSATSRAEIYIPFGETQVLLEGELTFYKGFRGPGQVRCVFDMPNHINIVRTELLK